MLLVLDSINKLREYLGFFLHSLFGWYTKFIVKIERALRPCEFGSSCFERSRSLCGDWKMSVSHSRESLFRINISHKGSAEGWDWPRRQNLRDVKTFCFANFYRRSVENLSLYFWPHFQIKKQGFYGLMLAQLHLSHWKTTSPVLANSDPEKPIILETDAPDFQSARVSITTLRRRYNSLASDLF